MLRDNNNLLLSAWIGFCIFLSIFFFFLWSLFFLTAAPSLCKIPTDMVKTKSNMIFHNVTLKQIYFYLVNTFIGLEKLVKICC